MIKFMMYINNGNGDSVVIQCIGYGVDHLGFDFLEGQENVPSLRDPGTLEAYSVCYEMITRGSLPGSKAVVA
jgi:hypothetical protein